MANSDSIYRRLTGRKRTLLGYSQLWLGPGHILLLKSARFAEEYRRFALSDIQAIVITARPDDVMVRVAGLSAAVAWTLGVLIVSSVFAKGFFIFTGVVGLAVVLVDIARGPRCRCYLHTAVSRELLAPVARLSTAREFLARIQPAIEAVQGRLSVERAAEQDEPPTPAVPDRPPAIRGAPGYLPEILFSLLLVNAVLVLLDQRFPSAIPLDLFLTTIFAEILLAAAVLLRGPIRDPRRMVYLLVAVTIVGMGWDIVGVMRSYFGWMTTQIAEAARQGKATPQVFYWASSRQSALLAAGWRIGAGLTGLAAAFFARREGTPT